MNGNPVLRILLLLLLFIPLGAVLEDGRFVAAVKVYELADDCLVTTVNQWKRLGINAVFAPQELLERHTALRPLMAEKGMALFLIVPVYYHPEAVKSRPEIRAVRADGKPAQVDWVEFVCPTHKEYRRERIREIVVLCRQHEPDVLSLDFIRHFAFWEMNHPGNPPSEMESTCTCPRCVSAFQEAMDGHKEPMAPEKVLGWLSRQGLMNQWRKWRVELINHMTRDIVAAVRAERPDTKFNLHLVPWRTQDYDHAAVNILGQDAAALGRIVDYISPMCYSFMLKRKSPWIHDCVAWLSEKVEIPILTSIQVSRAYGEKEPGLQQFGAAVREACRAPSSGIVFWNWEMLSRDQGKLRRVEKILTTQKKGRSF